MAAGPQGPMEGHTGGYGPPGGQPVAPPPQGGYPPTAQSGYPPSGYDGRQQQQGPGLGERASEVAHAVHRQVRTPETKPFYTTSEFLVWLLTVIGVLIAGAVIDNGDHGDALRAGTVWVLVTVISFGYIISRGISKAGTRYRDPDDRSPYSRGGF